MFLSFVGLALLPAPNNPWPWGPLQAGWKLYLILLCEAIWLAFLATAVASILSLWLKSLRTHVQRETGSRASTNRESINKKAGYRW